MKKNKIYLILAIITSLILFTTAAVCNQCSAAEDPAPGEEEPPDEEPPEEEPPDEEPPEEEEPDENLSSPNIDLEIYEGPVYSEADEVCYYRVKAIVSGNPVPNVEFSRDDSGGSWGGLKAQVNLNDPSDSYTLTATAVNSEGEDTDSITLNWDCNRNPVISEIILMGDHFAGVEYEVSVAASDPDDDMLSYKWSAEGGTIDDDTEESIVWTTPDTPGNYDLTVVVKDGKGGQDSKTATVEVTGLSMVINLPIVACEGGYVVKDEFVRGCHEIYIGDSAGNHASRGFISFDISSLSGVTIKSATLTLSLDQRLNKPEDAFEKFYINWTSWGPVPLEPDTYYMAGAYIETYPGSTSGNINLEDDEEMINAIQRHINEGKPRFQLVLRFHYPSVDDEGDWDGLRYLQSDINLKVEYIP